MSAIERLYQDFAVVNLQVKHRFGGIVQALMGASHASSAVPDARSEGVHYPDTDFLDRATGSQCFMHRHDSARRDSLHIHFFYRWQPKSLALDHAITTHLVALDLSLEGEPLGWFLVNQWVVGDFWQEAKKTLDMAKKWRISAHDTQSSDFLPDALIANWLNLVLAMAVKTSLPEILEERDQRIDEILSHSPNRKILTDRRIEIMGYRPFMIPQRG